jgi:hypothetical protein
MTATWGSAEHTRQLNLRRSLDYALFPTRRHTGERPAHGVALASEHPAVGRAQRGHLLHRVGRMAVAWDGAGDRHHGVVWGCGGMCVDPALGPADDEGQLCPRCDWAGLHDDGSVLVYFAQGDGLVKIGASSSVTRRVASLRATLLATEPGGFGREHELHERFAGDRVAGEWFRPSDALLAHIRALSAQVPA